MIRLTVPSLPMLMFAFDQMDPGKHYPRSIFQVSGDPTAGRILDEEHKAYPEALRRLLSEPWRVAGRRLLFGEAAGE